MNSKAVRRTNCKELILHLLNGITEYEISYTIRDLGYQSSVRKSRFTLS